MFSEIQTFWIFQAISDAENIKTNVIGLEKILNIGVDNFFIRNNPWS